MSIEVHIRVRPTTDPAWATADTVLYALHAKHGTRYAFNRVHPPSASNGSLFESIEPVVRAGFDGKNVTVMAYGQTGSGKTHTMTGTSDDGGVVRRAARLLMDLCRGSSDGVTVVASVVEVYNEAIRDLLQPERGELMLRDAPDGGVRLQRCTVEIRSWEDFAAMIQRAEAQRTYGVTDLNEHSSRSHTVLCFEVTRGGVVSTINLVDLAGSESATRAHTDGVALREGGFINRSLLTLGNVVDGIVDGRPHIPFRESKLTRLLRTSLVGGGLTFIVCCVNPSRENVEQTIASLRFAQRAMKIKSDPTVTVSMPPLFTVQLAEAMDSAARFSDECAERVYERTLAECYAKCTPSIAPWVAQGMGEAQGALRQLGQAQCLLVALDHANGCHHLEQLDEQRSALQVRRQDLAGRRNATAKRQRAVQDDVHSLREKKRRAEVRLAGLAQEEAATRSEWESRLHQSYAQQVSEILVVEAEERCGRARLYHQYLMAIEATLEAHIRGIPKVLGVDSINAWTHPGAADESRERCAVLQRQVQDLTAARSLLQESLEEARVTPPRLPRSATPIRDVVTPPRMASTPPRGDGVGAVGSASGYVSPYSQRVLRSPQGPPRTPSLRPLKDAVARLRDARSLFSPHTLHPPSPTPREAGMAPSPSTSRPLLSPPTEETPPIVGIAARRRMEGAPMRAHHQNAVAALSLSLSPSPATPKKRPLSRR